MFKHGIYYGADGEGAGGGAGVGGTQGAPGTAAGGGAGTAGAGSQAGGQGTESPWYTTSVRPDLHQTLSAKGWDKVPQADFPNTVLEAYSGVEKLLGRSRLAIPKDASDTEAYDAIFSTLGRPGKASEYKLDGLNETYVKALAPETKQAYLDAMHKAGLSQTQAEALFKANETQFLGAADTQAKRAAAAEKAQQDALALDWGVKLEANQAIAAATARALGLDGETMTKIEDGLGYDGLYKLLHKIGSKIGEDSLAGTGQGSEFGGGPAAAQAEINRLKNDREFMAKLQHRDPRIKQDALNTWEDLHKRLTANV